MNTFYFLRQNIFDELGTLEIVGHTTVTGQFNWISGKKFLTPVPKETLLLDITHGTRFPDFFDTSIPVMSKALIATLHKAGAANFDEYPMIMKRKDSGKTCEGYSAVNVIGCVDAVNVKESPHRLRFGKPYYTDSIIIDEKKAPKLKMFRLLYGPGFIVIGESLAKTLYAKNFQSVLIQPTTEYKGL